MRAQSPRRYPVEVQRPEDVPQGRVYRAVPVRGPDIGRRASPGRVASRPGERIHTQLVPKPSCDHLRRPLLLLMNAISCVLPVCWCAVCADSPAKNVRWDLSAMSASAAPNRPGPLLSQPEFHTLRAAPEDIQYVVVKELRERLAAFYRLYNPANLGLVDNIIRSFIEKGSTPEALEELNEELWQSYGSDLDYSMPSGPNSTHSGQAGRTSHNYNQVGSRIADPSHSVPHPMFDVAAPPAALSPTQYRFQDRNSVWNSTSMTDFSYPPRSPRAIKYSDGHSASRQRSPQAAGALSSYQHSTPYLNSDAWGSVRVSTDHWLMSTPSQRGFPFSTFPQSIPPTSPREAPLTLPVCPSKSRFQPFRMDVLTYTVVAVVGFVPRHADEMAFLTNDVMVVTGECIDGWLLASKRGSEGLVPAAYVRFIGSDGQQLERGL